ncbi:hypothetical protein E3P92_03595 [Wallemia ichthyophaga]|uniref:Uncharacterized protein n=2 Tax=Wallemia ichthyophaga TaxID=245174 RepID=A0A4T0G7K6_WALIC|nr:uncharacterized protein J056_004441 [Wallemia ichthyophaga EXF-994]TIA73817.1 hypothetical protein E3P91_01301 [Wallemia ichthyophaga]EOR01120.1 hypothetical protein J056_004441 [Wallemia ichthyophaga EXF-994]TIA83306.1 hypothetical protein E3P98_00822 [Wallemia ichthyophaga]TIA92274.1 hypothetical protein E3P97_01610 [Wallemia ichthyophaga]TIA95796.1 hypothetical protein E3P95_03531 [Wallemia ichthyophaga]
MDKVQDKIQGAWKGFHGAGEAIRGTFNESVDRAGDQVAGRQAGSVESKSDNPGTSKQGLEEMKDGMDKLNSKGNTGGSQEGSVEQPNSTQSQQVHSVPPKLPERQ